MSIRRAASALTLSFSMLLPNVSFAHDFWLAPKMFQNQIKPDASLTLVPVAVMIGHPKDQMSWPVNPHRIVSLRSIGEDGITDQQASVEVYALREQLPVTLRAEGLHVLTIETTHSVSVLEADKFNAYVEEEGITPIQNDRVQKQALKTSGREIYSRRGKALIQVGKPSANTSMKALKPIGMTLEIVPTVNPYLLQPGEPFVSEIYYRGKLMSGVSIGLVSLDTEAGHIKTIVSDKSGRVSFPRPEQGGWMLHAVWSDPMETSNRAEYDTVFSSLSFGFSK